MHGSTHALIPLIKAAAAESARLSELISAKSKEINGAISTRDAARLKTLMAERAGFRADNA
jgi:hypothetical protein